MSQLYKYFENNTQNCIHKWRHYFEIYEFWFTKYKNKEIVLLEIGVYQGGSLKMWRDFFGERAKIYAIDINPLCQQFEDENTKIFIGSQDDRNFLESVKARIPKIDILIDDGGHSMKQQITTFEELYDHIKEDGIYLCEDLHTSYWKTYGGGFKNKKSFIEYSKNFIDNLNAWHSEDYNLKVNTFTRTTYSLHYYDSILILQKRLINPPTSEMKGEIFIPLEQFPPPKIKKNRLYQYLLKIYKRIFNKK